jgi:RHS repeat-associated protein
VSLPKSGGAIRGIGEKFSANPTSGTGSMSVPIATSPGRSGFGPQLSLSYDSGRGNGPFGFGWAISLPTVSLRTDKGLPRYDASDVFVLSDAEDLVPVLAPGPDGNWAPDDPVSADYRIERYRPRVEGSFARIERWTRRSDGDTHWRTVTRDNVAHRYGQDTNSRVFDPADPARVFSWLLCHSEDGRGNAIGYEYLEESGEGVDPAQAHERHRTDVGRSANRYLKRIRYGNRVSTLVDPERPEPGWMFEVVLDYGEHDDQAPTPSPVRDVPCRVDPFSSYRAGFEVRNYRLCRRVLMFHHFPGEDGVGADCLVGSTDLEYTSAEATGDFLGSVTQRGYRRQGAGYLTRSMPAVEFGYTPANVTGDLHDVDPDSLANLPAGLGAAGHQWVDLDGDGIPGVLAAGADAWFFKPNLGDGRLGPMLAVPGVPTAAVGVPTRPQLLDLSGNGQLDVVTFAGPTPGYLERTAAGGWQPWRTFDALPTVDLSGPDARFVDLNGDGHADLLVSEGGSLTWYPATGGTGFGPGVTLCTAVDEESGPRLVFADGTSSLHLADASGDGLADLVRVRNGEVCYWPNLGHGRFGARVAMDNAPWFDTDERFDQRNLRLADVDGSGPVDLIYLGTSGVQVHLNRSGNGWAPPVTLTGLPAPDPAVTVDTVDLLGTGTTCLVWSSTHTADAGHAMRYADLMGGVKPHLLQRVVNNLGAETLVRYAPSTRFFFADRAAGRPWLTRLAFPVQVVERVETYDRVSRNRFVTRYAYHHGYFDGLDREFRGFGMTEQWDTEELGALGDVDLAQVSNQDPASSVPPVLTRTWTHTGAFLDVGASLAEGYAAEYWREPGPSRTGGLVPLLPDTVLRADGTRLPHRPDTEELREACRALKGSPLRQEVYALDGSPEQDRPYLVTESSTAVELLQPMAGQPHTVCLPRPAETVTRHHERRLYAIDRSGQVAALADPRVTHDLVLDVDGVGNVLRGVSVAYGRRYPDADLDFRLPPWAVDAVSESQTATHVVLTVNGFTNAVDEPGGHRTPMPCESQVYELSNVAVPAEALLGVDEVRALCDAAADGAHDLPYEHGGSAPDDAVYRRLVEHVRTLYRPDDLTAVLPLGESESLGLAHRNYRLALTSALVGAFPDPPVDLEAALGAEGGYLPGDEGFPLADPAGRWWVPSGRLLYSPDPQTDELAWARVHFFLPGRAVDPFGNVTTIRYAYDLLAVEVADAMGNVVTAENDFRVLAPRLVSDPNRNRAAVAFDALGTVTATAVMGKTEERLGDSLDGLDPDPSDDVLAAYLTDSLADPHKLLGRASTRLVSDLFAFARTSQDPDPQPVVVASIARETHLSDLDPGEQTKVQYAFSYSDGFGREIQRKGLAAPGPLVEGGPAVDPRWVGSGWTIFNNKGKPVRQYEPFFTATHGFEFARTEGVSPILCYDPVGRVIAALHPDHTWEKVVVDPWRQLRWDVNDTVLTAPSLDPDVGGYVARLPEADYLPTWYARRADGAMGALEQAAAAKAEPHANTPGVTYLDSLSRAFLTVAHNRAERPDAPIEEALQPTRVVFDIEGNQRSVVDALGRIVMTYDYDMLGTATHSASMEAGQRWMLADVSGQPLFGWDSRDHRLRTSYDALRRPTEVRLRTGAGPEQLVARTVYGESPDAVGQNLRGKPFRVFDGAGVVTTAEYDFKANPLSGSRQLAVDYKSTPDWSASVALEPESFTTSTTFDALNRPVEQLTPDASTVRRTYAESGALATVDANLRGDRLWTQFVTGIDYDAKGQRRQISYGNGAITTYRYDPLTFRLIRLQTLRERDPLQDLSYVYDPAGNITHIQDDAQQTVFFRNTVVEPTNDYRYDATYQLIEATGREHLGQTGVQRNPPTPPGPFNTFHTGLDHPGDGNAMGRYTERYFYDAVGNFQKMQHEGSDPKHPGWTRAYLYEDLSQIEADRVRGIFNNRLTSTQVGNRTIEPYEYDAHGSVTSMLHLPLMRWNHLDQLEASSRQVRNDGTPEIIYYVYDGSGQRVRKVTENDADPGVTPTRQKERIYLGGFEIYREYTVGEVNLERDTVHTMDDTRPIALVEIRTMGNDGSSAQLVRYQLVNHLGSSALELDELAQIINYEEYFPYGSSSYQAVRSRTETPSRHRYTGTERDEESGLYCHAFRYFAPWLGRWTAVDPAGFQDGTNVFEFGRNNPVRFTDAAGLASSDDVESPQLADAYQALSPTSIGAGIADYVHQREEGRQIIRDIVRASGYSTSPTVDIISDLTHGYNGSPSIRGASTPLYESVEASVNANSNAESYSIFGALAYKLFDIFVMQPLIELHTDPINARLGYLDDTPMGWAVYLLLVSPAAAGVKPGGGALSSLVIPPSHQLSGPSGRSPATTFRNSPGVAFGHENLPTYDSPGKWMRAEGMVAGTMPRQVGEQLSGREFRSFAHMRAEFWRLVEADPILSAGWSSSNQALISLGKAPFAPLAYRIGGRMRYELEHIKEIQDFGAGMVYYLPNIRVASPFAHVWKFDLYAPLRR